MIGEGGYVSGVEEEEAEVEEVEAEEEEREIEREEEEVAVVVMDEVGLWQREGRLRLRFKSEKLGMCRRRRCERIIAR
jgi:hypothetical protein